MGLMRTLLGLGEAVDSVVTSPGDGPKFAVDADSIDPAVFGLASYASPTSPSPRIDRRTAIQCPAVKMCRDVICGPFAGLPLHVYNAQRQQAVSALFEQPEKDRPRAITMVRTAEDLLFEQIAWWRVVEVGWHSFPVKVKRLDPRKVTVNEDEGKVYVNGKHVPDEELIRFDSPNDGLLTAGARAIRTSLMLENAVQRYAEGAPPVDYFTPAEGADPANDADVKEFLNSWKTSRQERSTGYVPFALKYNVGGFNPEQIQLAEARQHAALEIGRLAGVDPETLGISVTSRSYFNAEHKRKEFLDFTLGPYLNAIEQRLSLNDVTPRGYYAKFNLDAFLRSDTATRYGTYAIGLSEKFLTLEEVRELEDRPPLDVAQLAQVRALPAPQEDAS